jgi:hypothetical protein
MTNLTQTEARKEINAIAKSNGFIMRKQNMTINGAQAYKFEDRSSGRVLISNMTFWSAYENAQHPETWKK